MDYLSIIRKPIEQDLEDFKQVFEKVLTRDDGLLGQVLGHIRQRGGKRMRPFTLQSDWSYCIPPVWCMMMWWMRVASVEDRPQ